MNTGDCKKILMLKSIFFSRYYEGGVASTYVWDKEDGGFALAFLMKKGE